jgi:3-dehydroquinate synthase
MIFKNYTLEVGRGLLKGGLPEGFVITDTNLQKLFPNLIRKDTFVIPAGEESKNLETYTKIIKDLEKINPQTIIAFGGGVVGDLAGFVASTYKRGIELIHVPTSLLAMVDSSLGGKNGVNLGEKKNYVGTIYMPNKIILELDFLKTLPQQEFSEGMAEIIKYSLMFGKPSYDSILDLSEENLEKVILECCKIKTEIIEKDERDQNVRHTLNFGHTIGHSIELLHGLKHGQAISIGMVKEIDLAIKKGLASKESRLRLVDLLKKYNLPTDLPITFDKIKALEIMKADKKGELIFAFDEKNHSVQCSEEEILEVLR